MSGDAETPGDAIHHHNEWMLYVARLACNPYSVGVAQPMAVCRSWLAFVDPLKLKVFFHSPEHNKSQWRPPDDWDDELATVPPLAVLKGTDGRRVYVLRDSECLLQYFVDAGTGRAQWRPPDDVRAAVKEGEGAEVDWDAGSEEIGTEGARASSMGDAATVLVKVRLHGLPWIRRRPSGQADGSPSLGHAGPWSIYQSRQEKTFGLLYYHNPFTNSTQWEVPQGLLTFDDSNWGPGPARTDPERPLTLEKSPKKASTSRVEPVLAAAEASSQAMDTLEVSASSQAKGTLEVSVNETPGATAISAESHQALSVSAAALEPSVAASAATQDDSTAYWIAKLPDAVLSSTPTAASASSAPLSDEPVAHTDNAGSPARSSEGVVADAPAVVLDASSAGDGATANAEESFDLGNLMEHLAAVRKAGAEREAEEAAKSPAPEPSSALGVASPPKHQSKRRVVEMDWRSGLGLGLGIGFGAGAVIRTRQYATHTKEEAAEIAAAAETAMTVKKAVESAPAAPAATAAATANTDSPMNKRRSNAAEETPQRALSPPPTEVTPRRPSLPVPAIAHAAVTAHPAEEIEADALSMIGDALGLGLADLRIKVDAPDNAAVTGDSPSSLRIAALASEASGKLESDITALETELRAGKSASTSSGSSKQQLLEALTSKRASAARLKDFIEKSRLRAIADSLKQEQLSEEARQLFEAESLAKREAVSERKKKSAAALMSAISSVEHLKKAEAERVREQSEKDKAFATKIREEELARVKARKEADRARKEKAKELKERLLSPSSAAGGGGGGGGSGLRRPPLSSKKSGDAATASEDDKDAGAADSDGAAPSSAPQTNIPRSSSTLRPKVTSGMRGEKQPRSNSEG